MDFLTDPKVLGMWALVGLIAGVIGRKIFYRKRSGGGGFGSLVTTTINGMVGAGIGMAVGHFAGIPGADSFGVVLILLAIAGTLIVMAIASRFSR
jgi:uncharacterized membrane protein YeaQ/YmgE (transglycosylase-associated protein family)